MSNNTPQLVSLAEHPRAAGAIRRAKAFGGLAGFALAFLASQMADGSFTDSLWRGVLGGIAGNLVTWAASVAWWQTMLRAEAIAAARMVREKRERDTRERQSERERRRRGEA